MRTAVLTPPVRDNMAGATSGNGEFVKPLGTLKQRAAEAAKIARELLARRPTWVTFFREVLGVDGVVRHLFPTPLELQAFEKTEAYAELLATLARLRRDDGREDDGGVECTRVITIRIPRSLHVTLREDAALLQTSMNQLCISRLLDAAIQRTDHDARSR